MNEKQNNDEEFYVDPEHIEAMDEAVEKFKKRREAARKREKELSRYNRDDWGRKWVVNYQTEYSPIK